jgi:hypothetical protein
MDKGTNAFGRDGYVLEGLADAGRGFGKLLKAVLLVVAVVVVLEVVWHVVPALAAKDSPPAACQLLGGQWSVWTGWTCA